MELNQFASEMMGDLEQSLNPYKDHFSTHTQLPKAGRDRQEILQEMETFKAMEAARWREGFASGAVYHGDEAHIQFQNQVYALHSQSNPLHPDLWPSTTKFEREVVAMTAHMLGASKTNDQICGVVSSGGTESILLAIKTYRDWAREEKGITEPEMIAPVSAHAAFDKAAQYFGLKLHHVPVDEDYKADVSSVQAAINENTAVIVGSAPGFPHGVIDPIEELSELARENEIGFHTDGCLGGFLLPWAEKLGAPVPPFDFRLPGVTSISADTHKYGYAAKGTSVVLYRGLELRHHQYYITTDWPGGLYVSPTLAGSRPGALIAACWAAMVTMGEQGYMASTQKILETAAVIKKGIEEIPGLYILGDPLWVIAFASEGLDIYAIDDYLTQKGWSLTGLQMPPALHLCVTLRHTQPGWAEGFLEDLRAAVAYAQENPDVQGRMRPVYGLTANVTFAGLVRDFLKHYLDLVYK